MQNKFINSLTVCEEITGVSEISSRIPTFFVLVTDIDTEREALKGLALSLSLLAETSTDWETVCAEKMNEHIDNQFAKVKNVTTRFINCQNFDMEIAKL